MTPEEIQEKIDTAVEAAIAKSNSDIEKLRNKNSELLNEKRAAKAAADEAQLAADEATEAAARASNDTATLEKTIAARYAKQIETLTRERDGNSATLQKLLIDNGISAALSAANVAPHLSKAAAALLRAESDITIQDGAAMVAGVPLADHIASWTKTDGKDFVAAPQNGGGGSTGSTSMAANVNAWTAENFGKRTGEFMALVKTDKAAAVLAAQAAGQPSAIIDALSE